MATTKTLTYDVIAEPFVWALEGYKRTIAEFATKVVEDPSYAMKWGDRAVDAAGAHEVFSMVIAWCNGATEHGGKITPETLLASIITEALQRIVHSAEYPSRSTSPMANLNEVAKAAAWAEVRREAMRLDSRYNG